jgi:quinol monooxygenase YgiN
MAGETAEGQGWNVVELRQYTLRPGHRDDLVALFDSHLVEPQEEAGMRVVGQFRDLDRPDRFVWLRAFPDMASRARSLAAFYERHPAWREHREAANDTMVDSDNVLLLRPAGTGGALRAPGAVRPPAGAAETSGSGLITVGVHHLADEERLEDFAELFENRIRPTTAACGSSPLACFRTEGAENTFPALPVRAGEHVFVHVQRFTGAEDRRLFLDRLSAEPGWREEVVPQVMHSLVKRTEQLHLAPTARSALR